MEYYIAIGKDPQLWPTIYCVDGQNVRDIRIDGPGINAPDGEDAAASLIARMARLWNVQRLSLKPGQYYPRMARPDFSSIENSPGSNPANGDQRALIESISGQLIALLSQLEHVFRVVHPVEQNFGAFGHEIRNVLILASTEVELQWKGVLKANGVHDARTTREYVRLAEAMKLAEYRIRFPFYPWLPTIAPFHQWMSARPSQSLPWYDAYNAVKHNREDEFHRGTLLHALTALCGCAVMTFAQFGTEGLHYRSEIREFFELCAAPEWQPSDAYSGYLDGREAEGVHYPFPPI